MRRLLVLALCAGGAVACDPLLPLRARDAIQPVASMKLIFAQFSDTGSNLRSGSTVDVQVEAYDKGDNLITLGTSKKATWTVSDPLVAQIASSSDDGIRLLGQKVGTTTVTATIDGKTASRSLSVSPGNPAQIVALTSSGQLGVVADALLQPIEYEVRDAYGNAVGPNILVSFSASGGSVSPTSRGTDASGRAKVTYTPNATGSQLVTGRLSTTVSATVPVTVTTLSPALELALPDATNGTAITPAPKVQLKYASTSAAYPRAGLQVTASIIAGSGKTLTGGTATTDASGAATFGSLVVKGTEGPATLRFSVQSIGVFVDAATTLKGGLATKLEITTQPPSTAVTGRVLSQAPVIQLRDPDGNASPQKDVVIKATAGTFTLAGDQATTGPDGRATFSQLSVAGTAGTSFTLSFISTSHPNLTAVAATPRLLTGVQTKLVFARAASNVPCDAIPTTTPQVKLQDDANRDVSQGGVVVTATLATGTTAASIVSGNSATTDANGVATFSNLLVRGTVGSYSLVFAAGTLTQATSPFSLVGGAPKALAITAQPALTVANGATMSPAPAVRVLDACNNQLTTTALDVTVATTVAGTTGATFTNGTVATSTGVATFNGLTMAGAARKYKLQFSATGIPAVVATDSTNLTKGAGAKLVVTTEPSTTAGSNVALVQQPRVEVQDVGGNPVGGVVRSITATISGTTPSNGTTVTSGTVTLPATDSSVAFTGLKLTGLAGPYRLVFSASGLAIDTAVASTVLGGPGTASRIVLDTTPATGAMGGVVFARTPVIRLRDENNANVALAGYQAAVSATGSNYSFGGQFVVTDATGKASFPQLVIFSGTPNAPTPLTFTIGGVPAVTSPTTTVLAATLTNNATLSISSAAGTSRYYAIVVPAGKTQLQVTISSGTGDANLYVRATDVPGSSAANSTCSGELVGTSNEVCTIASPPAGQYFILVSGTTTYSGTLKAVYIP